MCLDAMTWQGFKIVRSADVSNAAVQAALAILAQAARRIQMSEKGKDGNHA